MNVAALCEDLARERDRPIRLLPLSSRPSNPSGLWVSAKTADYIFYEESAGSVHREHIILHEIGHLGSCSNSSPTSGSCRPMSPAGTGCTTWHGCSPANARRPVAPTPRRPYGGSCITSWPPPAGPSGCSTRIPSGRPPSIP
ncbi:hypothetical protein ACFPOI_31490 [Nonomuraea angiospora]|uniref:Uncharacterized protein n=1 Tax=Nonomuraea angiospora TaxID=46172 RepID=A0ABR9LSV1_9ACTN|nr:hypothetical protein [Nonomuraea angiospora]MBE1583348.1 hypothetical protein [Nonomuraea angiospora]